MAVASAEVLASPQKADYFGPYVNSLEAEDDELEWRTLEQIRGNPTLNKVLLLRRLLRGGLEPGGTNRTTPRRWSRQLCSFLSLFVRSRWFGGGLAPFPGEPGGTVM